MTLEAGLDHIELRIESNALPASVEVREYEGRESISAPFEWDVTVVYRDGELNTDDLVGAPAKLTLLLDGQEHRYVHGVVAQCVDLLSTESNHSSYRLRLVPTLWLTSMVENIDIFMDMTLPELLKYKLGLAALEQDVDYELRLTADYPLREFVVQFQETDLAFIARQCEHFGVSYHFEHNDSRDVVVFGDHNHAFSPITGERVTFMPRGEHSGMFELSHVTRVIPRQYVQRDYNYRAPDVDLVGQTSVGLAGTAGGVYQYGGHFKTNAEAAMIAEIRAQEQLTSRKVYSGQSVAPALTAGHVVTVVDHPHGPMALVVTAVTHRGRQGTRALSDGANTYQNSFQAIDSSTVYRPARLTPKPVATGMLSGIVESREGSGYADVDEHGRYRVRFLFDTAGEGERQASRPVRMMQPHAGAGYGMHFPLRHGTEVLITFVGGDPDRPIIAGTVPNPQTASPVNSTNRERNVIRTGGSNEINIDDTEGSERVKISVPHQDTVFQLGAPNFPESGAALQTKGAQTEIATQGITAAGGFQSAFSSFVNWLLSSTVVTDAGTPTGLELLSGGVEVYGGACDIALAVIATERGKLMAEEKEAAEAAFNAAGAATKAQQRCRSCRARAMDSLPTAYNDPAKLRAEGARLAALDVTTLNNEEKALLAIYQYELACDADDDTYLTSIGTLEDRNGIVLAAREGTNPDFDPVMDRDAWEEIRKYDDDLFIEMRQQWDRERWDNTRDGRDHDDGDADPLYPDMLTIDEKLAYHAASDYTLPSDWSDKNEQEKSNWYYAGSNAQNKDTAFSKWQKEEQARWDPNYIQRLTDKQAWVASSDAAKATQLTPDPNATFSALTSLQKAETLDPKPAGWQNMDDAARAAHWDGLTSAEKTAAQAAYVQAAWTNATEIQIEAAEKKFLDSQKQAWPEVPSKLDRQQKKANMDAALATAAATTPAYGTYQAAMDACYANGGCADLDALRKTAIQTEELYCENMRSHGEELRTLREEEIKVQKAKDWGAGAAGAALSVIISIASLAKGGGARTSLKGKWAAAKTLLDVIPLQKARQAHPHAVARKAFNKAHTGTETGIGKLEIKRRTRRRYAYWPFGPYVHHVGSENDLSLGADDTVTLATKTALILGVGKRAAPGVPSAGAAAGAAFLNAMTGSNLLGDVADTAEGNVFILAGESVRVGAGDELELSSGESTRMTTGRMRVRARTRLQMFSTDNAGAAGEPDGDAIQAEFRMAQDQILLRNFRNAQQNEVGGSLELKGPVTTVNVQGTNANLARLEMSAYKPNGAVSAQLLLNDTDVADLLAGHWGMRADAAAEKVTLGNDGWELMVADEDIKLGAQGAGAQLTITDDTTTLTGGTVTVGAADGTVNISANTLNIGPAALQSANLVVKGEMNAKVQQLRQSLTQAIQGANQSATRAQNGVRKLKRRVTRLEQD